MATAHNIAEDQTQDVVKMANNSGVISYFDVVLREALLKYNKHTGKNIDKLYPLQVVCLKAVLAGETILTLPTGSGKSLIYELLPFIYNIIGKTSLVITLIPLDAILTQQLENLGDMAIGLKQDTLNDSVQKKLQDNTIQYVFCHREVILNSKKLKLFLSELNIDHVHLTVDEAHVVFLWGDDFRQDFRRICEIRVIFPSVVILAMTATATEEGLQTIKESLGMTHPKIIKVSPIRSNITLIVAQRPPSTGGGHLVEESYANPFCGLFNELMESAEFPQTVVYCPLHWCQVGYELAQRQLEDKFKLNGAPQVSEYHAHLHSEVKKHILSEIERGQLKIIFATEALGMGADMRKVTRILHVGPPTTIESYIQQIGRAGRSNQQATAILLYNNSDVGANVQHMTDSMRKFCKDNVKCRRVYLAEHFQATCPSHGGADCCDFCNKKLLDKCPKSLAIPEVDLADDKLLSQIEGTLQYYVNSDDKLKVLLPPDILHTIAMSWPSIKNSVELMSIYSLPPTVADNIYAIASGVVGEPS